MCAKSQRGTNVKNDRRSWQIIYVFCLLAATGCPTQTFQTLVTLTAPTAEYRCGPWSKERMGTSTDPRALAEPATLARSSELLVRAH
jgi:hypothetical protein